MPSTAANPAIAKPVLPVVVNGGIQTADAPVRSEHSFAIPPGGNGGNHVILHTCWRPPRLQAPAKHNPRTSQAAPPRCQADEAHRVKSPRSVRR